MVSINLNSFAFIRDFRHFPYNILTILIRFPFGNLDLQNQAVQEIGIRFHASRGSLNKSISQGRLAPDRIVEHEAAANRAGSQLRSPLAVGAILWGFSLCGSYVTAEFIFSQPKI